MIKDNGKGPFEFTVNVLHYLNSISVYRLYNQKIKNIPVLLELIRVQVNDGLKFMVKPKSSIKHEDFIKSNYYL